MVAGLTNIWKALLIEKKLKLMFKCHWKIVNLNCLITILNK